MQEPGAQHPPRLVLVGRSHDHDVRQAAQVGHVIRAGVRGSVAAHHAGAVDGEHHRKILQHHVVHDLVVRALQERGVDRHHRLQSLACEPRGERHAVLLGDRDVEIPLGIELLESLHLRPLAHRGRNRHQPLVALGHVAQPLSEDLRIRRPRRRRRRVRHDPHRRVERRADAVILHRVGFRRGVALALAGDDVQQLRASEPPEILQRRKQGVQVVPVDRSDVVEAELLEQGAGNDQTLDVLLGAARELLHWRHPAEDLPSAFLDRGVETAREELGETVGERPDVRRDRHLVVVEHDEHVGAGAPGVIQGLERHAAGEASVADDGDDLAIAPGALRRDRHPRCRPDRRTRVADPEGVVGALAALGKRRDASPLAYRVHLIATPGENLVRVALMADIPDDAVVRGVVEKMKRDGELDRSEPGREVSAGARDALDKIPAELPGDFGEGPFGYPAQICRRIDAGEHGIVRCRSHGPIPVWHFMKRNERLPSRRPLSGEAGTQGKADSFQG